MSKLLNSPRYAVRSAWHTVTTATDSKDPSVWIQQVNIPYVNKCKN
ncbi:hypothetical protein PL2TA16_04264 [Pseudoalteromonas luteoviolacea 2ta16]|uniref:Uncharacterized protein n=1 Tax=Pseudoalteromonas luteoviolacea (strain 2ta16) TaxID=1353533 RepID=V4H4Q5_PSEL2|nr:hypothetical protein [Pseudoalteromonas sp. Of7M-16]ESP92456.1 hypothetical protein PL2TA16_04264 [Pseudoalteromonas luteoviolacea 2ta16]